MSKITYQEWIEQIKWLRNKIILPDNRRIEKSIFMTNGQVDADKLNKLLKEYYGRI